MNCPFCGGEMREGLIESGKPILWVVEEKGLLIPDKEKGEFYVSEGFWQGCCQAADYCPACKKIILSVPDEDGRGPFDFIKNKFKKK